MDQSGIKKMVREGYARVAQKSSSCCAPVNSCCGTNEGMQGRSRKIGYSEKELQSVPEGANLGLGCGNPTALASLREGETVLDLGSGAGFDCFLAANQVGEKGKVIGVDMTPEMIDKARENVRKGNYRNVEFRLGEIESLPVADNAVDVIVSNCVINLSPDKRQVFREALRVLKPGGRLMVSDIVLLQELPASIKNSIEAYIGCLAGAVLKDEYLAAIQAAGFQDVRIMDQTSYSLSWLNNDPTGKAILEKLKIKPEQAEEIASPVMSIKVEGKKAG